MVTALHPEYTPTDWRRDTTPSRRQRVTSALQRAVAAAVCFFALFAGGALVASPTAHGIGPDVEDLCGIVVDGIGSYSSDGSSIRPTLINPGDLTTERSEAFWFRDTPTWDSNYTLYEMMGTSGLTLSFTGYGKQDGFKGPNSDGEWSNCSPTNGAMNSMANLMLGLTQTLTDITIEFRKFAVNPQPMVGFMANMSEPFISLRDGFYIPALVLAVTLVGLWLILPGGNDKSRQIIPTLGLSFGMLLLGVLLTMNRTSSLPPELAAPAGGEKLTVSASQPNYFWATSYSVDTLNRFNNAAATAMLSGVTKNTEQKDNWCALPEGAAQRERRIYDCMVYREMALRPWMEAQFGSRMAQAAPFDKSVAYIPPTGKFNSKWVAAEPPMDIRLLQLHVQGKSLDYYSTSDKAKKDGIFNAGGKGADETGASLRAGAFNHIRESMWENYNGDFAMWQGAQPGTRFQSAVMGVVGALMLCAFNIITSAGVAFWMAALVILFFLLPLAAWCGVVPWTQKIMLQYLNTWGKALSHVGLFQLVQPLAILLIAAAMGLPNTVPQPVKLVVLLLFGLALLKLLAAARSGAAAPDLGGAGTGEFDPAKAAHEAKNKTLDAGRQLNETRAAKATKGLATGAGAAVAVTTGRKVKQRVTDPLADRRTAKKVAATRAKQNMREEGYGTLQRRFTKDGRAQFKDQKKENRQELASELSELREKTDYSAVNPLAAASAGFVAGATGRRRVAAASIKGADKGSAARNALIRRSEIARKADKQASAEKSAAAAQKRVDERNQYARQTADHRTETREWSEWVASGAGDTWQGRPVSKAWTKGAPVAPLRPGKGNELDRLSQSAAAEVEKRRTSLQAEFDAERSKNPKLERDSFMRSKVQATSASHERESRDFAAARAGVQRTNAEVEKLQRQIREAKAANDTARASNLSGKVTQKQAELVQRKQSVLDAGARMRKAQSEALTTRRAAEAALRIERNKTKV